MNLKELKFELTESELEKVAGGGENFTSEQKDYIKQLKQHPFLIKSTAFAVGFVGGPLGMIGGKAVNKLLDQGSNGDASDKEMIEAKELFQSMGNSVFAGGATSTALAGTAILAGAVATTACLVRRRLKK